MIRSPLIMAVFALASFGSQAVAADFGELAEDIAARGIDSVLESLSQSAKTEDDRRILLALGSRRAVIRQHPDQTWFQLQAHSRWTGWENVQDWLMASQPETGLVALSSSLPAPVPGTITTWDMNIETQGTPYILRLTLSPDQKKLYCELTNPDLVLVIDLTSQSIVSRHELSDTSAGVFLTGNNRTEIAWPGRSGRRIRGHELEIRNLLTGEIHARLKHRIEPPVAISPDGQHLVFWGSRFVWRQLSDDSFKHPGSSGRPSDYVSIDFAAGGRLVAVDQSGFLRHIRYPGGPEPAEPVRILPAARITAINPQLTQIACSGTDADGEPVVVVWSLTESKEICRFRIPGSDDKGKVSVTAMAFLDADNLMTGTRGGIVHTWTIENPWPHHSVQVSTPGITQYGLQRPGRAPETITRRLSPITALQPLSSTRAAVATHDRQLKLVDFDTDMEPPQPLLPASYPDTIYLDTGDKFTAKILDGTLTITSRRFLGGSREFTIPADLQDSIPHKEELPRSLSYGLIAVSPDDGLAASVTYTGTVFLWDTESNSLLHRYDLGRRIEALHFDGRYLIVSEPKKNGGRPHAFYYQTAE